MFFIRPRGVLFLLAAPTLLILGGVAARFIFKGLPPPNANCFHLHKLGTRRRRESERALAARLINFVTKRAAVGWVFTVLQQQRT